jgi:hypothetical protein
MGEVIFKFDSTEEADEIRMVIDGYKYKLTLWDLDQELRSIVKHGYHNNKELTSEQYNIVSELRDKLWEIMNSHNINLD